MSKDPSIRPRGAARTASADVDACPHPPQSLVDIPESGEIVCRACGAVRAEGLVASDACDGGVGAGARHVHEGGRKSMYLEMEIGCGQIRGGQSSLQSGSCGGGTYQSAQAARRLRKASRYVSNRGSGRSTDLGYVSNISQKMNIPNDAAQEIYALYRKLRGNLRLTRAKLMILAFYAVCRCRGVPADTGRLAEYIRMELGVRYVHTYLKAIMEASACVDEQGNLILQKIGYLDMTGEISGNHYINCEIARIVSQYGYNGAVAQRIIEKAKSLLPVVMRMRGADGKDRDGDAGRRIAAARSIAKTAVRLAEQKCGCRQRARG